jgi:hypothetical protein
MIFLSRLLYDPAITSEYVACIGGGGIVADTQIGLHTEQPRKRSLAASTGKVFF